MNKIKTITLVVLSLFFAQGAVAQGWQWGRGNTGGNTDSWSVATDPSGNVFASGSYVSFDSGANFGSYTIPYSYGYQVILVKYDANGNFLWANSTQDGDAYPINIATDHSGNCIVFGAISSQSIQIGSITLTNPICPSTQYFLAKYDPSGNVIWAKNDGNVQGFMNTVGGPLCGSNVGATGGIAIDAANNIYITANFSLPAITVGSYTLTNASSDSVFDDIFVAKYDSLGNVVWATRSGSEGMDDAYGLTVTPSGNIYIAGTFSSSSVTFGPSTITNTGGSLGNAFIAEYNALGVPIWASSSGGSGNEFALGVASDAANNVYLAGGLGDTSISYSGTTVINPTPGNASLYLIKFDPSNNVTWYKTIGGTNRSDAIGFSIAMSPCGVIWVSGAFSGPNGSGIQNAEINIDGHILDEPEGSNDAVFIAGYNANGAYAGSAALQSGGDDQNGIACDALGNVYMCADYAYPCNAFVIGNDTLPIVTNDDAELQYLAKYTFVNTSPDTFFTQQDMAICPNAGIILDAPQGYAGYLWNNGSNGETLPIDAAGTYWVIGSGECTVVDSITVSYNSECGCYAFLPSAFTPNNDGKDDYYQPLIISGCAVTNYSFSIYNRWGERVFYTEDPNSKWDGRYNGTKQDIGTYMYYLKYTSGINNTITTKKGDVTLIR